MGLDDRQVFQLAVVRRWDVLARQTNRRCIELVETLLGDQGDQLSADATGLHALFNDHDPVGLGDGALWH